jgi:uncharacterized protein
MTNALLSIVRCSVIYSRTAILIWLAISVGAGCYFFTAFAVDTNVNNLISRDLPWRKGELAYQAAFPQGREAILIVIEAPTSEQAGAASHDLASALAKQPALFRSVQEEGGGRFFTQSRFMFLPAAEVEKGLGRLTQAKPIISFLVSDQSLRGVAKTLVYVLHGLQVENYSLDAAAKVLNEASQVLENVADGQLAAFSWGEMLHSGEQPTGRRRLISVQPKLFAEQLQPGREASNAIRRAARDLDLGSKFQATIRLTGPVPLTDEQFASVTEGGVVNGLVTLVIVIIALAAALRSWRLVVAVGVTLIAGLLVTAGAGLFITGALNPISIAFAMLFVGLGADFAVQYTVRYRAQRHEGAQLPQSLVEAAEFLGAPLTLAAISAAAGFLSFIPTNYQGLAQLGEIAGLGMVVAYASSFTLLPALIKVVRASDEPRVIGQPWLAPTDNFLRRRRFLIIGGTLAIVSAGTYFLPSLAFDFNPIHLQRSGSEPVATFLELSHDPLMDASAAQIVVAPSEDAQAIAAKVAKLPQVAEVRTIESFIPNNQNVKLAIVNKARAALAPAFRPKLKPAPTDQENVMVLKAASAELINAAGRDQGLGALAARRLAHGIDALIDADATVRERAAEAFLAPLRGDLEALKLSLQPLPITLQTLPHDFARLWVTEDGFQRIDVLPKGDPNSDSTIRSFASAVLAMEPNATGQAVSVLMWSKTMIAALIQAGAIALFAIAIILWVVLRRIGDVLLTLIPLLVAGVVTLEICAAIGFRLNYANIIALPALLGIGVAFKIYYVTAWRRGEMEFLQSPLTRAVFFSALLTATAFGSLSFSSNPGMSSMGELLALSLACTLASAVLFQPALMGNPRQSDLWKSNEVRQ